MTGSLILTGYMLAACLLLVIEWHCCHCIFILYSVLDVMVFLSGCFLYDCSIYYVLSYPVMGVDGEINSIQF